MTANNGECGDYITQHSRWREEFLREKAPTESGQTNKQNHCNQ